MLIDCPYYEEYMSGRNNTSHMNCWDEDFMFDNGRCDCNAPGCTHPICDYEKNGYNSEGVFVAKVDEMQLNKAESQYNLKEALKPQNITKRLDRIEKMLGGG